ncbi:MAG TPA: sigma-70 family RNA polymerase sigma factor [Puia sp.]
MISIAEIKSGDESSFTAVFNQYYTRVYYYFDKKTRSQESARELTQLTFIKLWQFRHTLSEDHSFNGQLFRIAATTLIDYLRSQNTQRKKFPQLSEKAAQAAENAQVQAGTGFEENDYLHSLTSSLSPVRKKVFILSRMHGHSYKEIAEQLSISIHTVEDHMVKALRHIRSIASHLFVLLLLIGWLY